MLSLPPVGETAGWVHLSALSCATLATGWHRKSETVLLTLFSVPSLKFFCPPNGVLNFSATPGSHKGTRICVWLPKSVFFGRKRVENSCSTILLMPFSLGFPVLSRFGKIPSEILGVDLEQHSHFNLEVCLFRCYISSGVRFGRLYVQRELSTSFTLWNKFIHSEKECGF